MSDGNSVATDLIAGLTEYAEVLEDDRPIHTFFGLSYANYLVLPRSVMQAMPTGWQRQMVHLLERVQEKFGDLYSNRLYDVKLVADSDAETGEAIAYEPDPLANYRQPIPELRPDEK